MLTRSALAGLTLASAVLAHPAIQKRDDVADMTLIDAAASQPTLLNDQPVVFMAENGQDTVTKIEDVMIEPTASGVTVVTLTTHSTETVSVGSKPTADSKAIEQGSKKAKAPDGAALFGVSYAPYAKSGECKTQQHVDDDISRVIKDYSMIRIYGTDCDQVSKVYNAAKAHNAKLFLGIWDMNMVEQEAQEIIKGVQGDWDRVNTVSVGNELVNKGQASAPQVIQAVKQARSILRNAGYQGPVVAVDTFNAVESNPEICDESDYCAFNAHPFFDGNNRAENAGPWLQQTIARIQSRLADPNMKIVISETGWPHDGNANSQAVPSMQNQRSALASIKESFAQNPSDVVLFSAFNDLWKQNSMDTFNAEQFWGIDGAVSSSDSDGTNYWA